MRWGLGIVLFALECQALPCQPLHWEQSQLRLILQSVKQALLSPPQDKRDADKSTKANSGEDGLKEILAPAHHAPAHGGQHAQPAGHCLA